MRIISQATRSADPHPRTALPVLANTMLERESELAAVSAALGSATAGTGSLVLIEGPSGIGKTTLLRTACGQPDASGLRVLTARGLALESGFSYGIVRQLIEPVRAAAGPAEWQELLDGAAGLAVRIFGSADAGPLEDDVPYATIHGLYWLAANLAARGPLAIVVDDAHWSDVPSLRWLAHLAARLDDLPVTVLLAIRSGQDQAGVLAELRDFPGCVTVPLRPLSQDATASLVRERLGERANEALCLTCHESTGGNPFLLQALAAALCGQGDSELLARAGSLAPGQIARTVLRQIRQAGDGAEDLTRALAVLGGPAPLRRVAVQAGQELAGAARLADQLRAADVLAPGGMLEFAHSIVRTAIYESIPAGERALAHARAARLLTGDGADAEHIALHLLRGEPDGSADVVAALRTAADVATGRGAPGAAAAYLRRALAEPPNPATRPAVLLELGLALARERDPAAPATLREAVALTVVPDAHARAALTSAHALGLWGHHDTVVAVCQDALAGPGSMAQDGGTTGDLEAELFANAWISGSTARDALRRGRRYLADPAASTAWRVHGALVEAVAAQPSRDALARLGPVLDAGLPGVAQDSLTAVYALLVLIWTGELGTAGQICDAVLSAARDRGSMNMVTHASCLRSIIMRRSGRLDDAAADGRLALDFELASSPALAVAWTASFCVDALTCLGQLDEADAVAGAVAARQPPEGWIHTLIFRQARAGLRVAQGRYREALDDIDATIEDWQRIGIDNPAVASWRTPAVAASLALGKRRQAAELAREQLALARKVDNPVLVGDALRVRAAAIPGAALADLAEAVRLLEGTKARYELALALTDLGACLRRSGRRGDARWPLRRALDLAERTGAATLAEQARGELLAAGARPRRTALTGPDALTSAESRVVGLAVGGLSNRQIAQHLFITQLTVETHLRHAFGKLAISSRAELAAVLDSELPSAV